MENKNLIPITVFCKHYNVEATFIQSLNEVGLLEITVIEQTPHLYEHQLAAAERMVNLHQELGVNTEGIDVIIHLLQRVEDLQTEMRALRNRLDLYE